MKIAILVHTFDERAFIWPKFFECFVKNFPKLDIFEYYFANESLSFKIPDYFRHIKTGYGEWSDRLKIALSNIKEDNLLYLQEDFLITKVNNKALINAIYYHINNYNVITKLDTNMFFNTIINQDKPEIIEHIFGSKFIMSHQPIAIFNNEFMKYTCPNPPVSARTHEYVATDALNNIPEIFNRIKILSNSNAIEYIHGIADGKLIVNLEEI